MPWTHDWDGICRVYNKWEADGVTWTIEDLHPDDDDAAVHLLITYLLAEVGFCKRSEVIKEEASVQSIKVFWKKLFGDRTSLACYRLADGSKQLVALNACAVKSQDDEPINIAEMQGEKIKLVLAAFFHFESMVDTFKELGVTQYLSGAGLLVVPQYRGARLGQKILDAREPLCRHLGLRATATVFNGPRSQKSAARAGFRTLLDVSYSQLAEAGFYFPGDQTEIVKLMAKNYD